MNYWQFIHSKLLENKTVYTMTVIQHKGSSPGRQGFKMAVASDNEIFGSIGGGIMEYNLVERCKKLLQKGEQNTFIEHLEHKGTKNGGSGMICSGEQTVVFYPLNNSNLSFVSDILNTLKENKSGLLSVFPNSIEFSTKKNNDAKYKYSHKNETDWSYHEQLNQKDILYIVGGGHVGLATSKLFNQLGFYVVVFDNRDNLNTFEANKFAHKKKIIEYNAVAEAIPESNTTYVAIMTNKYTDDKLVLSKLVRKKYKYIGVLGSKAKLETMFDVLQKEGFSKSELDNVNAPIGLPIFSQTPDEIAISIAAQVIGIKNRK